MERSLVDSPGTVAAKPQPFFACELAPFAWRAVGLGVPLVLFSAPIWSDLWDLWLHRYGFSHGFLVPLVSLYLVWLQWPRLRRIPVQPAILPGALWLVSATLLLLASEVAGVMTLGSLALILVLAGLVLLLCGGTSLKVLAVPLAYLIFMTPVLDIVTEPLEWPFQLLTANMSAFLLQTVGVPVMLENQIFLVLPTVTLEVARECSGAGLLIAVLAIGLPLAHLTLKAWWSRITLVFSSVIMAIMANWLRVTVMGLYAQAGGKDLHGPYHILQGLFVDWVAFGFLFLGAWLLSTWEHAAPSSSWQPRDRVSGRSLGPDSTGHRAWWLACATLASATGVLYALAHGATGLQKNLAEFPTVIGEWTLDYQPNDVVLFALPDADQSLARVYRAPDGRRVNLYIAYTNVQRQGKELVGMHTAPLHAKALVTGLSNAEGAVSATRTLLEKNHRAIPALFWYHIDGRRYGDRYEAKLATLTQALRRGRTDGALVLVSDEGRATQGVEQWTSLEELAGLVFPLMHEYLP